MSNLKDSNTHSLISFADNAFNEYIRVNNIGKESEAIPLLREVFAHGVSIGMSFAINNLKAVI